MTAVAALGDSLRSGLNGALWTYNGNTTFSGAGVTVSSPASTTVYGGIDSAQNWSLAGSAMYARLVDPGDQALASWQVFMSAAASSGGVQWMLQGGQLAAQANTGSGYADVATVTYTGTIRWLRIREASGTVYWDYSADGQSWTTLTSAADPVALDSVQVQIGAGTYASEATATSATWADFGTQFPQAPLDLRTELCLAPGEWTDASTYVMQREGDSPKVSAQRGRQDESTQANASSATLELNNRDGRFSPKNAMGPYYGQLSKNTPVRLSVPAPTPYLSLEADGHLAYDGMAFAQTSALTFSGTVLDVRVDCELTDWRACILAAQWGGGGDHSWALGLTSAGFPACSYYDSSGGSHGVTSTAAVPMGRQVIRWVLTTSDGSGNRYNTFYTGPSMEGPWTELYQSAPTAGTITLDSSASGVTVGYSAGYIQVDGNTSYRGLTGRVYAAQLYSGTTLLAAPDFTAAALGTGNVTDGQGNTWTLYNAAVIDNRDYRYHGELSALPAKWDATGQDQAIEVTAGGPLRRLTQQNSPVQSPMKRGILSQPGSLYPVAYWPMEDGQDATQLGSAVGGAPLAITDGTPNLAASTAFTCSNPIPEMNGCQFRAYLPPVASTNTVIMRALVCEGSTAPTQSPWPLLSVFTSGLGRCDIVFYSDQLSLGMQTSAYTSPAVNFGQDAPGGTLQSQPMWVSLELQQNGSSVDIALVVMFPGDPYTTSLAYEYSASFTGTVGAPQQVLVHGGSMTDTAVGHIQVQTAWTSMFNLGGPAGAWAGETAAARYARLCGENGYACRIVGPPASSATMGPQAIDTLPNLLQACEDADRGQVTEPRAVSALGYRTVASLYSQTPGLTADYTASHPGGTQGSGDSELEPTYDDQLTLNDETVTRSAGNVSGGTFQYQLDDGSPMSISPPPAGAGDYANSLSVAVDSDSQLPDIAAWMVHVGTADEYRWPAIPFNLARGAVAPIAADLAALDIGDLVEITGLPGQVTTDPVRILVWELAESLGGFHRTIAITGVPASPYDVLTVGGANRIPSGESTLAASVTAAATTLSVATASGPLWTTAAGDFPFDVMCGGEQMTVTAITGTSSPQAFTVIRAVNGVSKAHAAGASIDVYPMTAIAL